MGLGDVGRTVLAGLVLLGGGLLREIAVYDPHEALCARCEMEFNQILSPDGTPLPQVVPVSMEGLFL